MYEVAIFIAGFAVAHLFWVGAWWWIGRVI